MSLNPPGPVAVRAADDLKKNAYDPTTRQGVIESPRGSNRGPAIDIYNMAAGVPEGSCWCASAVYYRLLMAAHALDVDLPADLLLANGFAAAAAGAYADWAKRHGRWIAIDAARSGSIVPMKGDLACFDIPAEHGIHHIGFVLSAGKGGAVTGEGNTHPDGELTRDGYCVAVRRRSWEEFGPAGGFVRLPPL